MAASSRRNPFYLLLIASGSAFAITAFAYGFMAFQEVNAVRSEAAHHAAHPLFSWLRVYGNSAMLGELAVLAVLTVGCMVFDREPSDASHAKTKRGRTTRPRSQQEDS